MSLRRHALTTVLALSAGLPAWAQSEPNPKDPIEGWNRGVFAFNEGLDNAILKPVATAYRDVVPSPLRTGVSNFFGNWSDAWSAVNHFLQGKVQDGVEMTMRVAVNTTLGFAGILDVAGDVQGLDKREEDLGQTLGVWGMPSGPYIVWPLFGPSALRESVAMPVDRGFGPGLAFGDPNDLLGLSILSIVDARANLLGATKLLDEIALDKYSFVRDAYLARRQSLVYDGNPPETSDNEPEAPADAASAPAAAGQR